MAFAKHHGVYGDAGFGSELFEAVAFEFVSHEGGALLGGQFVERGLDLVEENAAGVSGFGAGVGRGQQLFQRKAFGVFYARGMAADRGRQSLRLLFAKEIGDAVAGHAKEPGARLFHRREKAKGRDEFVEDLLKDVFGLAGVGHAPTDETGEAGAIASRSFEDAAIVFAHVSRGGCGKAAGAFPGPIGRQIGARQGRGICKADGFCSQRCLLRDKGTRAC
jgi:hypothetical protein